MTILKCYKSNAWYVIIRFIQIKLHLTENYMNVRAWLCVCVWYVKGDLTYSLRTRLKWIAKYWCQDAGTLRGITYGTLCRKLLVTLYFFNSRSQDELKINVELSSSWRHSVFVNAYKWGAYAIHSRRKICIKLPSVLTPSELQFFDAFIDKNCQLWCLSGCFRKSCYLVLPFIVQYSN